MTKYLIAHDLGTSGNKASLFTTEGQYIGSTISEYNTDYFNSNWAEQNPEDWWHAVCETNKLLTKNIDIKDVLAICFSGQMMGCVCVDRKGQALRKAIIWADMRATKQANQILSKIDKDVFYRTTGHKCSSSYSIEKLMWVRDNEPDIYNNTYKTLNPKDYIVTRLTGQFLTDYSDASGTNAFDLNTFKWSEKILDAAGIDIDKFPEAVPSTHIAGEISESMSAECGLYPGTKVVMGGGDGMCASVGAGSVSLGKTYNCLGSSSWIATTTKEPIYDDQYRTFNWAHLVPGFVAPCGTMQSAGASFNWVKNQICTSEVIEAKQKGISPYELINEEISQSVIGSNGLIFLPYLLGERSPRWNPEAKGAFIGLKLEHKRADILRSVIEGIAYNLNIILQVFSSHMDIDEITVIGGMAKGDIQRRILADVFNTRLITLNYLDEASSIGAAVCAGVAIGELKSFSEVDKFNKAVAQDDPIAENAASYAKYMPVFDKCYTSLVDVYTDLAALER
jgi:xylulokinase